MPRRPPPIHRTVDAGPINRPMCAERSGGKVDVMNEPVIEISGLRKTYGSVAAVDDIIADACVAVRCSACSARTARERPQRWRPPWACAPRTPARCACSGWTRHGIRIAVRQRVGVQLQQAVLPDRMKVSEAMAVFASAYRNHADSRQLLVDWGLSAQRNTVVRGLVGRPEAAAVHRARPARQPGDRRAGRTHHRAGSRRPARHLGDGAGAARPRCHRGARHALPWRRPRRSATGWLSSTTAGSSRRARRIRGARTATPPSRPRISRTPPPPSEGPPE